MSHAAQVKKTARSVNVTMSFSFIWSAKSIMSLRKSRSKKCRVRIETWRSSEGRPDMAGPLGRSPPGRDLVGVFLEDELAEDVGQGGQMHELAEAVDRVVGHDLSLVEDDDPAADLLGD